MPHLSPRAILLPLLALAACGAPAGYPSLAPRPIERLSTAEPAPAPAVPAPAVPLPPALAQAVEQALRGHAAFEAARAAQAPRIARGRGAAVGSEPWIAAQQALSVLEAARGPVTTALAALDAARTAGGGAAVEAACAEVEALAAAERAAVSAAGAGLAQP